MSFRWEGRRHWRTPANSTNLSVVAFDFSSLPHLAVSSSTPPPSTSPIPVKIKSEPISPPRDPHAGSAGSNGSVSGPSSASASLHHPGQYDEPGLTNYELALL